MSVDALHPSVLDPRIITKEYEGQVFSAQNPTPGSSIAQSIVAAFTTTDAVLALRNVSTSSDKILIPLWLRLINGVVPASATQSRVVVTLDQQRYQSGGTLITAMNNVDFRDARVAEAAVRFGALTLTAETASIRRMANSMVKMAIPAIGDEFVLTFGGAFGHMSAALGGAGIRGVANLPTVVVSKDMSMYVHLWHPGNAITAASWEFELCWMERD